MNAKKLEANAREIAWPSVITVISAAILIGAEVFGAPRVACWHGGRLGASVMRALLGGPCRQVRDSAPRGMTQVHQPWLLDCAIRATAASYRCLRAGLVIFHAATTCKAAMIPWPYYNQASTQGGLERAFKTTNKAF